ncbi:hypothetical protein NDU88_006443 [Pleurodeles waltl]|uniref:Uncharacterized protein n=1 Tax=Pleurodeles waltl TaxID=8319 RepID=A0AAV7SPL0_PLEWA|nr:hypothetical protein NDU88_006443 [Pleurodeles waltl]
MELLGPADTGPGTTPNLRDEDTPVAGPRVGCNRSRLVGAFVNLEITLHWAAYQRESSAHAVTGPAGVPGAGEQAGTAIGGRRAR